MQWQGLMAQKASCVSNKPWKHGIRWFDYIPLLSLHAFSPWFYLTRTTTLHKPLLTFQNLCKNRISGRNIFLPSYLLGRIKDLAYHDWRCRISSVQFWGRHCVCLLFPGLKSLLYPRAGVSNPPHTCRAWYARPSCSAHHHQPGL